MRPPVRTGGSDHSSRKGADAPHALCRRRANRFRSRDRMHVSLRAILIRARVRMIRGMIASRVPVSYVVSKRLPIHSAVSRVCSCSRYCSCSCCFPLLSTGLPVAAAGELRARLSLFHHHHRLRLAAPHSFFPDSRCKCSSLPVWACLRCLPCPACAVYAAPVARECGMK